VAGVFAAVLAAVTAVLAAPLGAGAAGPSLLTAGAAYAVLTLLVLVPYTRLRVEFLLRLYQDVAAHPAHPPSESQKVTRRPAFLMGRGWNPLLYVARMSIR